MEKINRRDFLKIGLVGLGTLAFVPGNYGLV